MTLYIVLPPEFLADMKSIAESLKVIAAVMSRPDPPGEPVRAELHIDPIKHEVLSPQPPKE